MFLAGKKKKMKNTKKLDLFKILSSEFVLKIIEKDRIMCSKAIEALVWLLLLHSFIFCNFEVWGMFVWWESASRSKGFYLIAMEAISLFNLILICSFFFYIIWLSKATWKLEGGFTLYCVPTGKSMPHMTYPIVWTSIWHVIAVKKCSRKTWMC